MANADLGRLVATLEARAERFDLTLQRATQRLDKVAGDTERSNNRIARSTRALDAIATGAARGFTILATAATAVGGAVAYFAARQFQALDALGDLAAQTGLTATELRQLQVGLELNGGTAEAASEGLLTFSRNLGQVEAGTGRLTGLLKKLDPAFLETLRTAGSTGDALRLVADRIAVARSEQEKLAIAMAAFGGAGRQFVLLLGDGARGLSAFQREMESLGIDNLEEVTAAAQRLDDQLKRLRNAVTTQFVRGLFGLGEGLDSISDALDDKTIKNIGEFAKNFGELAGIVAGFAVGKFGAIAEILNSMREGGLTGGVSGVLDALTSTEKLSGVLDDTEREIGQLESRIARLRRQTEDFSPADVFEADWLRARRAELEQAEQDLLDLEGRSRRIRAELSSRQPFVGRRPPQGPREEVVTETGAELAPPGARAPEAAHQKALDAMERQQEAFIDKMREAARGAISEADQLRFDLTERLAKIDEAVKKGAITQAEALAFRTGAIREAADAIAQAELEAFEKQQQGIEQFLQQFGGATVSAAEQIARDVEEALDKIPWLTDKQRAELKEIADAFGRSAEAKGVAEIDLELKRRAAAVQSGAFGGISRSLEQELQKAEAIAEKSKLDEIIRSKISGGAELEAALARNQELLEQQLDNIESTWDETLTTIGEFGEQVFADMVEGWVQGAEVNFDGILRSFIALLLKMEAEAAAKDLFGALRGAGGAGGGGGAASLIGSILGAAKFIWAGVAEGGAVTPSGSIARLERITGLAEGGGRAPIGSVRALTGEAGTERLLSFEKVREIIEKSGGDPAKAAQLAMRTGEKLERPEVRDLAPGDLVIPDRKMNRFFERVMPKARAADGGLAPLSRMEVMTGALSQSSAAGNGVGGGLKVIVNNQAANQVQVTNIRQSRGLDLSQQLELTIEALVLKNLGRGGALGQRLEPGGPGAGLR